MTPTAKPGVQKKEGVMLFLGLPKLSKKVDQTITRYYFNNQTIKILI